MKIAVLLIFVFSLNLAHADFDVTINSTQNIQGATLDLWYQSTHRIGCDVVGELDKQEVFVNESNKLEFTIITKKFSYCRGPLWRATLNLNVKGVKPALRNGQNKWASAVVYLRNTEAEGPLAVYNYTCKKAVPAEEYAKQCFSDYFGQYHTVTSLLAFLGEGQTTEVNLNFEK